MNSAEIESLMLPMPPELEAVLKRPAWQAEAACRGDGVDTFFPDSHEDPRNVIAICVSWPVKTECVNYPLGIWPSRVVRRAQPKPATTAGEPMRKGHRVILDGVDFVDLCGGR